MKKATNLFLALCVALVATIALCGCGGDKSDGSSIVIGIPQDIEDSLDPHEAVAAGTKEIFFNIYEGLVKPDASGNIVPAVAERFEVSNNGLEYQFTLRKGVKFHNGDEVTAEDVVYSIKKSAGMLGNDSLTAAFANIKDVTASGNVVTISLKESDVDFIAYLANANAAIIPQSNQNPGTQAIGTGPYMYVSRSPQENIILKSFKDYWGGEADIDDITLKVVADADSIVMNLNGGSVDMFCRLTTDQVAQLSDSFDVYDGAMNLVQAVYLNNAFEPFSNIKVRQALSYGVDVQALLDLTSEGQGYPVGSSMFPAFKKYYVDLSDSYPYDVEKAKSLLAEAGYPNGFEFTITVPSNYQQHIDAAQVVADQLSKIGVKANIQLIEWSSWLSDVYSGRNYEATVVGVDASSMTASAMLSRFVSDASNNFVNYSNEKYDSLYKKVLATTDDEARTKIYKDLQEILAEDAANVYIQDMAEFVCLSNKYEGYTFYPVYVQDFAKLKVKK